MRQAKDFFIYSLIFWCLVLTRQEGKKREKELEYDIKLASIYVSSDMRLLKNKQIFPKEVGAGFTEEVTLTSFICPVLGIKPQGFGHDRQVLYRELYPRPTCVLKGESQFVRWTRAMIREKGHFRQRKQFIMHGEMK
jgi:hypothetical protein